MFEQYELLLIDPRELCLYHGQCVFSKLPASKCSDKTFGIVLETGCCFSSHESALGTLPVHSKNDGTVILNSHDNTKGDDWARCPDEH